MAREPVEVHSEFQTVELFPEWPGDEQVNQLLIQPEESHTNQEEMEVWCDKFDYFWPPSIEKICRNKQVFWQNPEEVLASFDEKQMKVPRPKRLERRGTKP